MRIGDEAVLIRGLAAGSSAYFAKYAERLARRVGRSG